MIHGPSAAGATAVDMRMKYEPSAAGATAVDKQGDGPRAAPQRGWRLAVIPLTPGWRRRLGLPAAP